MQISLKATRLGLRNSTTRLPFRYGRACLTRCPQAVLQATIEVGGHRAVGYGGDCLPPGWFDKSPTKNYAQQIDDMLAAIAYAESTFAEELARSGTFFPAWLAVNRRIQSCAQDRGWTSLLASFGASVVERAVIDAMARAANLPFHQLVRENHLGIVPGEVHPDLKSLRPAQWLPAEPLSRIYVRHTVGLSDPLTAADMADDQSLNDGFPQSLEEYLARTGIRYLKIKVSNQRDHDVARLLEIAALLQRHRGEDFRVTLDGNEQYQRADQFEELIDALCERSELATLWANTLVVEQPLARDVALDAKHTAGMRRLSETLPVIIDESDGTLDAYRRAIELGYRGVSSKNCKGTTQSLLNCGLTWLHNDRGAQRRYVMTGEDLCSVGVVPVQADLCLAATLGLKHVERNGHHYHPGLSYLSPAEQQAALAAHGDFYARQHGRIAPQMSGGRFQIGSLHGPGFGFGALPDMEAMQSLDQWQYSSLGLEE